MGKLLILSFTAAGAAAAAAAPAAAQEARRQEARATCGEAVRCPDQRRAGFVWFYHGHDEGVRPARWVVRRLSDD